MKFMKLSLVAFAAFVFFGCSQKAPVVESDSSVDYLSQAENSLQSVYFDFDKSNVRADQEVVVISNSQVLNTGPVQGHHITVSGNCDEWGSDEYNYALGVKRAASVAKQMVQNGVSPERISLLSFGESAPICTEHTKECWAQNRRSDIYILPLIR